MRPAGVSITNDGPQRLVAVGDAARRPVVRRHQGHGGLRGERDAVVPVERLGTDRRIVVAHDGVVAERRDHARVELRGEPRQRLDVEMVVVAMRHQHDVDRRQRVERDARIVHADRPEEAHRRDALATTPDRSGCSARRSAAASSHGPHRRAAIPARRRAPAAGRCTGSAPRPAIRPSARPMYQRISVARLFGGEPCGSKKWTPSKWSDTGPS